MDARGLRASVTSTLGFAEQIALGEPCGLAGRRSRILRSVTSIRDPLHGCAIQQQLRKRHNLRRCTLQHHARVAQLARGRITAARGSTAQTQLWRRRQAQLQTGPAAGGAWATVDVSLFPIDTPARPCWRLPPGGRVSRAIGVWARRLRGLLGAALFFTGYESARTRQAEVRRRKSAPRPWVRRSLSVRVPVENVKQSPAGRQCRLLRGVANPPGERGRGFYRGFGPRSGGSVLRDDPDTLLESAKRAWRGAAATSSARRAVWLRVRRLPAAVLSMW